MAASQSHEVKELQEMNDSHSHIHSSTAYNDEAAHQAESKVAG